MDQSYYQQNGMQAQLASGQMGYPQLGYAFPQQGAPGMQTQFQQPIRLARFPGDALHGPAQPGMMHPAAYQAGMTIQAQMGPRGPLQPQLLPVGRSAGPMAPMPMGHPGPQMTGVPAYVLQHTQFQQAVGGPRMPFGSMPMQTLSGMGTMQMQQQPYNAPQSGIATPRPPGSGMQTPAHPFQHSRLPSASGPPGFQAQPVPGPPGISLPDSLLSPGSPGTISLTQPPSPGNRAQLTQSQQLAPLRGGTGLQQGAAMDLANVGVIPKVLGASPASKSGGGMSRAGSANSTQSTKGPGGRNGSLSAGGAVRLGSGKLGSAPVSRVGSAGKKSAAGELDEYDNIKVAVRVRPPNAQELARADPQALFVNPNDYRQIQLAVPGANGTAMARNFTFHACLGPTSRQHDVIRLCGINQLLDGAMDGFNTTIMAYGQTGSGKTYTMSGREDVIMDDGYMGDSDDGIMTRSAVYLFEQMQRRNDSCNYSIRVSYLEIYNEAVYDLLKFDKKPLQVRWDANKGFHVPELYVKECHTLEDLLKAISRGMRHRRVGSHELNLESSRSHSIMTIYCDCTPMRTDDHEYGTTRFGKVSLVDLAGSERVRDSKSSGETLKETTNINRSLFMLGNVISALADGARGARVPYRDSKLTRLLMDSLGGSSLSLIIACCSPSAAHVEESLSTLTYASRAKNIRNQPTQQVDPQEAAIAALHRELRLLRAENTYLREQLFQANMPRNQAPPSRLPSSHGVHPGIAGAPNQQFPVGAVSPFAAVQSAAEPAVAHGVPMVADGTVEEGASGIAPVRAPVSRPASAGRLQADGAAMSAMQASSITSEELLRRLLETQRMLVQFSRENDRLAGENGRLRAGKNLVSTDYQGALEEVEWLRTKLESLESSLLRASVDATVGSPTKIEVLEAARAATQSRGISRTSPGSSPIADSAPSAQMFPPEADEAAAAELQPQTTRFHRAEVEKILGDEDKEGTLPSAFPMGHDTVSDGTKPPLIAPELLHDPSELITATGTEEEAVGVLPADASDQTAQGHVTEEQQQEVLPATEEAVDEEIVQHSRPPAASMSSDDIEGAEALLPAGEKASVTETAEAADVLLPAESDAAAGVIAMVTLAESATISHRKAAVAWMVGDDDVPTEEGGEQDDTVTVAAEKLQQLLFSSREAEEAHIAR